MSNIESRAETWRKNLLEMGKRNRLLNFKETKRANLNIVTPSLSELFEAVVVQEKFLCFSYPIEADMVEEINMFDIEEQISEQKFHVIQGDFETNQTVVEQQKTLKSLRSKAKTAIEEQGVNVLYLAFGFLTWKESVGAKESLCSPVVLVPVTLSVESLTSPYRLALHDDEVVLNPTLKYKMEHDFNISFPEFDADVDSIVDYLGKIKQIVADYRWKVENRVSLSIFSFLKINMYMDLKRRSEALTNNFAIKALCGDVSELPELSSDLADLNHDIMHSPMEVFQTVDADSSQQDAIELSKRGISFVLQGPPGTGKSQTITNIISEALADGKKVLFVSEKMAALGVVYRRLEKVGLADFCLTLHNHKANKKEILQNLGATLKLDRIRIREEALYELEVLQQERQGLNDYAHELHTVVKPMEKSIYQVNGLLAKLQEVPNLMFAFEGVEKVSASEMRQLVYLLERFSKTLGLLTEDYNENVWMGSCVPQVTHEIRQRIENTAHALTNAFTRFLQDAQQLYDTMGFGGQMTYQRLLLIAEMLPLCLNTPRIPKTWFHNGDMQAMLEMVTTCSEQQCLYNGAKEQIEHRFTAEVYDIDALRKREVIANLYDNIKVDKSCYPDKESVFAGVETIIAYSGKGIALLQGLQSQIATVTVPYGISPSITIADISAFLPVLTEMSKPLHGTNLWFDKSGLDSAYARCQELSSLQQNLTMKRHEVLQTYEKSIFDIDCENILIRFKTEYTSFLKIFKTTYKTDVNVLRANIIVPVKKISDAEIIQTLTSLKAIKELELEFAGKSQGAEELLGSAFVGETTDFDAIMEEMQSCRMVMEYTGFHASNGLRRLMLSTENKSGILAAIGEIAGMLADEELKNALTTAGANPDGSIADTLEMLTVLQRNGAALQQEYNELCGCATVTCNYSCLEDTLEKLCLMEEIEFQLAQNENDLKGTFQFMFDGTNTDWAEIRKSLEWLSKFMPYVERLSLGEELIDYVISHEHTEELGALFDHINRMDSSCKEDLDWFDALYENEYQIEKLPLADATEKLHRCARNLHGLELWNDFNRAIAECRNNQLGQVVDMALDQKLQPGCLGNAFKKRFYKLWLDAVMPSYPAVYKFRRQPHEDMIERFRTYDKKQMDIAKARVKERLISHLPDVNKATSAKDEVGILKRELSKQRKIMPIRKLFANIPNLLPALKPCLMMSPLSVSLFLDSELYQFDMVIFDEASQVRTENAIGAIMRGKQIIVAGDKEQLPPTDFFQANSTDADYDSDVEEEDTDDYESVLDEMLTSFPERSLKWHYRSKNEELITFSNVKIYNQSLVTFPSASERTPNNGVEYIYVENGVYDRGGKKNNISEAKRVVQLVVDHFENCGNRSIGVIAFSSAQQQAIDDEITKLRLANPCYEPFFDEEKDEPFFVKNLENVQGDERDTIIFSIGYAKDARGVMYMNFGPLSRNGGYRRLNVAITRAKYNIKLVGSILPTDIKSDSNAEGVKMLRSYMEFAIRGKSALESELEYDKFVDVDSPFEEAVYDFLVSKGYGVTTQVGCSGYRIDMAVKHPTLDGRFVIAIECDGAAYHSSKTARERDRLRQTVLEDMGWTFHRIWSTDWIKDPLAESKRLIDAVEMAINTYVDGAVVEPVQQKENVGIAEQAYFEPETTMLTETMPQISKFATYVETDAFAARRGNWGWQGVCWAVLQTVTEEYPVHYEVLCRRIAPIFENQKATVKIREQVNFALNQLGTGVVQKGEFFYPSNATTITPKAPQLGETPRAIAHISDDEIGAALVIVASDSYGLSKQSLFQMVAKEFGFNRTGPKMTEAFERVFDGLVEAGELEYTEEKVRAKPI